MLLAAIMEFMLGIVQDVEEHLAQFGGHEGVEGVEPQDFASPPPSWLFLLDSWVIGELFCVALFLEFRTAHWLTHLLSESGILISVTSESTAELS